VNGDSSSSKKMLNRRNEARDLLKRKELALPGAQNELVFERKEAPSKRKIWPKIGMLWGLRGKQKPEDGAASF
jgi:hypothetical protein